MLLAKPDIKLSIATEAGINIIADPIKHGSFEFRVGKGFSSGKYC